MSAVRRPSLPVRPLTVAELDQVMPIEVQAYEFPWSRGNFIDSLAAGYWAQGLFGTDENFASRLLAYAWAMPGAGEVHLLNLTVAPALQGRGHARLILDHLVAWSRNLPADKLWLEVRPSNQRAISLYEHYGFQTVGRRPGYYPAAHGRREDATVMSLDLTALPPGSRPSEVPQ